MAVSPLARADDHWCEGEIAGTQLSITSGTVSIGTHVDVDDLVIVNDDTVRSGTLFVSIFAAEERRRPGQYLGGMPGFHLLDVEDHPNRDGLLRLRWASDGEQILLDPGASARNNFRYGLREPPDGTYWLYAFVYEWNSSRPENGARCFQAGWAFEEQATFGESGTPIRDFPVNIPGNCSREVQICVRDYSCEDGDEIRVTVNGDIVFEGELFTRPQCRDVAVREGDNPIEMLALNGTGGKGNCPNDVNTGEITVTSPGGNQTLQRWRHSGGAGSTANLVVTIGASTASCAFDPSAPPDEGGADHAGGAGHLRNLGDFNGDGRDDVLLRHADGRWRYYPMDGATVLAGSGAANLTRDLAWRTAGIGDFDGDGKDDVLLRKTDGRWFFYPMDGRNVLAGRGTARMTPDLAWQVAGIGDLDGDGRDDVLMRHEDGRWHYYRMNGRRPLAGSGSGWLTPDLNWQMAGVGDFDGDGKDDVLLRRRDDGRWYFYPMNGRAFIAGRGTVPLTRDLAWAAAGVGDFNGDGRDDVLMRHEDGRWRYYPMQGRRILAGSGAVNFAADTSATVAGVGDLNGDGRVDVLMRRADGSWHYYPMNGRRIIAGRREAAGLSRDLRWSVAGRSQGGPNAPVSGEEIEIAGTVVNYFTGDAIPGAIVSLTQYHNGSSRALGSLSSDADGMYRTSVAAMRPGRVTIRASAAGFAPQSEVLAVDASLDEASVTLRLLPVQTEARFQSGDDATVSVEGQEVLSLPAHSLVTASGRAVTGEVTARVTVLDASGDPGVMPGDFSSMGQDGAPMPIESFGAVNLELVNGAGEPVGLGGGAVATVSVPLADRRRPQDGPRSVPMYFWSDEMGRWIEDGEATLRETSSGQWAYVGSVNQLRTWNADLAFSTTTLSGCVTDSNGNAAASARVVGVGVDYIGRSETRTNDQGRFELSVRPDSRVLLTADAGSHSSTLTVRTGRGVTLPDCLTVSPAAATIRLTWGTNPRDLDSHLWGPTENGGTFHVYYGNRRVSSQGSTFELDVDDTSSFGPEIITISSFPIEGTYQYMVYRFSGTGSILDSPARVELNVGGAVTIFSPSNASGDVTNVWSVFEIEVDSNLVPRVVGVQRFVDRLAPVSGSEGVTGRLPEAGADRRGREGDSSRSRTPNPMSVPVKKKYYK